MKRLRVALVFSGQPRCVSGIAYEGFQRCILERYDVDVYAHFWDNVDTDKSVGHASQNIETFKALYSPKVLQIDPALRNDEYPLLFLQQHSPVPIRQTDILALTSANYAHWIRNCISMYESMFRAYELVKASGIEYDWIVRTRTDSVILRCPQLNLLNPNYMYGTQWHSQKEPFIVNSTLIASPAVAPILFSIRHVIETLPGSSDERFVFNHFHTAGAIDRVRTLPLSVFYPTLTRNGVSTDPFDPNLQSVVVEPPYSFFKWTSSSWDPI